MSLVGWPNFATCGAIHLPYAATLDSRGWSASARLRDISWASNHCFKRQRHTQVYDLSCWRQLSAKILINLDYSSKRILYVFDSFFSRITFGDEFRKQRR